jgi:hypothetical protein
MGCAGTRTGGRDVQTGPMSRTTHVVSLFLVLFTAACAVTRGPSADETATPDPSRPVRSVPELSTVPPSDAPMTGEVPAEILAELVADAAQRTATEAAEVDVIQAEAVTWNDGSLGCPEPGMMYTQALVDGYQVILRAGDEELDYRVGAGGGFRICEGGGRPSG